MTDRSTVQPPAGRRFLTKLAPFPAKSLTDTWKDEHRTANMQRARACSQHAARGPPSKCQCIPNAIIAIVFTLSIIKLDSSTSICHSLLSS